MKKLYLEGTKTMVLEDEKEVKLDYYLVEDFKNQRKNLLLYGIKIIMHLENCIEVEDTDPISDSKEIVKEIVHKLWNHDVTLVSMLEIVDDLVSEYV